MTALTTASRLPAENVEAAGGTGAVTTAGGVKKSVAWAGT